MGFGLGWVGLDWIGLDWVGLDWIGLDLGIDRLVRGQNPRGIYAIRHLYKWHDSDPCFNF